MHFRSVRSSSGFKEAIFNSYPSWIYTIGICFNILCLHFRLILPAVFLDSQLYFTTTCPGCWYSDFYTNTQHTQWECNMYNTHSGSATCTTDTHPYSSMFSARWSVAWLIVYWKQMCDVPYMYINYDKDSHLRGTCNNLSYLNFMLLSEASLATLKMIIHKKKSPHGH